VKKLTFVLASFLALPLLALSQNVLMPGTWHAAIKNSTGVEIPFNFEVNDSLGHVRLAIVNGAEHFLVPDIKTVGDSLFIHMPLFDSEFKAKFNGINLTGKWIRHLPQRDLYFDFNAEAQNPIRFKQSAAPMYNIEGRWSAIFASGDTTVAEFKQQGAKLTGTFFNHHRRLPLPGRRSCRRQPVPVVF